ncbi:GNAT family N-acetyltransferase [Corynebacterium casei]|uniref:GNAT family N-acetyltransferase n=1 Tax=Corynebacterium casei TaxID=160386 RepID=UPI003FD4B027
MTPTHGQSRKDWEADVILNDGGIASLRPIRTTDTEELRRFYSRVSDHSKYLRFFAAHPVLTDDDINLWVNTDGYEKVTLVMLERDNIIAVAGYELVDSFLPARVGDVSFLVQDSHHSRGCGNILLEHLAEIGREGGMERFYAEMLMTNRQMAQVFIRAGYSASPELEDGFLTVDFTIEPNTKSREVMERREMRAEANSIARILNPTSVAVVGSIDGVGSVIPSLVQGNYQGKLHILTTKSSEDFAVESLERLGEDIDLLLIEHAPGNLAAIMAAAAQRNAKSIIVVASSYNPNLSASDSRELVLTARDFGLRALGPAALGVINTDAAVRLNATPAPMPPAGSVGIFTQSAGVGTLVLSRAIERGLGISSFIAAGSFADLTGNDVIQYWGADDNTSICLLSLDSIGNPRKFFRVLRRLALEKHVVVFIPSRALKSARYYADDAPYELEDVDPRALDETIRNTGSMVVTRRETMYDIAHLLALQPLPQGNRVALISNSEGLTTQMEQAATRFGLDPRPVTVYKSPIENIADQAKQSIANPEIDAVLVVVVEVGSGHMLNRVSKELDELAAATQDTPLMGSFVGFRQPDFSPESLPIFDTYADALETLQIILSNENKRSDARPHPNDELVEGNYAKALHTVEEILRQSPDGRWATDAECAAILAAYDINVVPWFAVNTVEEAIMASKDLGWDVVLKSLSPMARGRSEWPAVIRHIRDEHSMKEAWNTLREMAVELALIEDSSTDISVLKPVVQANATTGASLTIRGVESTVVGPIVSAGISGITNDLLKDMAWRVPPIRRTDASLMLNSLAASPLLTGYRGAKASQMSTVEDLIMRLARLKDDISSIVEVELTPVIAGVTSTQVVGAKMRIAPLNARRDPLARAFSK